MDTGVGIFGDSSSARGRCCRAGLNGCCVEVTPDGNGDGAACAPCSKRKCSVCLRCRASSACRAAIADDILFCDSTAAVAGGAVVGVVAGGAVIGGAVVSGAVVGGAVGGVAVGGGGACAAAAMESIIARICC
eukprot:6212484-Pleurochrysis_carterae.AAC.4